MKQLVVIMLYGIALMNLCSFSTAETTPGSDNAGCLDVTEISSTNINIAWEQSCFTNSTTYVIQLIGTRCPEYTYQCPLGNDCNVDMSDICRPVPSPCTLVIFNVSGDLSNEIQSLSASVAPRFKENDWQLDKSARNGTIIYARWGPPESTDDVSCATKAQVEVTCKDGIGENYKMTYVTLYNSTIEGYAEIQIDNCAQENVTLTVTYMSEDEPTETKNSIVLEDTSTSSTTDLTTVTTDPTTANPKDASLEGWEIALIVIGTLVVVGIIAGAVFCFIKKIHCFK